MSVSLLEQPPVEEAPAPEAPRVAPGSRGYAVKLGPRRTAKRAPPTQSLRTKWGKRNADPKQRLIRIGLFVGLPGLLVVGVAALFFGGSMTPKVPLPPVLEASAFGDALVFESSSRVGTLFQATLREAPDPSSEADFHSRVAHVIAVLESSGYEALLIQAPDGTTLVKGPLRRPSIFPLGTKGT